MNLKIGVAILGFASSVWAQSGPTNAELKGIQIRRVSAYQIEVIGDPEKHSYEHLVYAGLTWATQYGLGAELSTDATVDGKVKFSGDLRIEPNAYVSGYSAGYGLHPFKNSVYVGARIRRIAFCEGCRGFDAKTDRQWTYGPELGLKKGFLKDRRMMATAVVSYNIIPKRTMDAPAQLDLKMGLSYRFGK